MFHKHNFELIDKTILPSAYEQMVASGKDFSMKNGNYLCFTQKLVLTFRCPACGKIEIKTEENP